MPNLTSEQLRSALLQLDAVLHDARRNLKRASDLAIRLRVELARQSEHEARSVKELNALLARHPVVKASEHCESNSPKQSES